MRIAVAGAGVTGLATALALGRAGHEVMLVDRDDVEILGPPDAALDWERSGIAHFLQPHAFIPRGRGELRALLPDVYAALLEAGASELDVSRRLKGRRQPGDEDMVYVAVRRPVIEWALRAAVRREPAITTLSRRKVTGLLIEPGGLPQITGVQLSSGESFRADLVVDAEGRTTSVPAWLAAAGVPIPADSSSVDVIYYSRYYRFRAGEGFPEDGWVTTPRGDLGYGAFSTFGGDNGTFATVLAIGSWDHELRILRHEPVYEAVCRSIRPLAPFFDVADPITPVRPMGGLQNTRRRYTADGRPRVVGLIAASDAVCHTDPTFALGLSFGLIHARAALAAVEAHGANPEALAAAYWSAIEPEVGERFALSVAADDARARMWKGERLDFSHANGNRELFSLVGAGAVALKDDDVLRAFVRRWGFLDRTAAFDNDRQLHAKIEALLASMLAAGTPPRLGPTRDELLALSA